MLFCWGCYKLVATPLLYLVINIILCYENYESLEDYEVEIVKNQTYEIKIEDMGSDGEGIGKVDGFTLFVKDTVIGDEALVKVIKVKKNYGYGKLEKIIKPSEFRVDPRCKISRQCGGCQLQHLDYLKQLEFKQNKIINSLERIGKFSGIKEIMEPIMGMELPYHYRNKAQFPIGKDKDGKVVMGFYANRTHSIIETSHCYIQSEVNDGIVERVRGYIVRNGVEPYDEESGSGVVRHLLTRVGDKTGEIMVCLVVTRRNLPNMDELVESLCEVEGMTGICLNVNDRNTNVILGDEVVWLWGKKFITDYIGDVKYQISPLSFYQVNPAQTKKLYDKALEYAGLTGEEVVWDLYCGIGTISLFLAKRARMVYGVEIVDEAIMDAKENARINGIENVRFFVGKAEEIVPGFYGGKNGSEIRKENGIVGDKVDVIVLDPPRKGCEESLLEAIVGIGPERIVYVSCDPGTLARDLRYLADRGGYEVRKGCGCDMFGMTGHVESVVLLTRKDG